MDATPGWVEVFVAEEEASRAKTILREVQSDHSDIDWSQVEVGDADEPSSTETRTGWTRWRRVCLSLVVIYLIAVAFGFVGDLVAFVQSVQKNFFP